ncbi:OmpH family outer membrane protein [Acidobacteriota bacterium]
MKRRSTKGILILVLIFVLASTGLAQQNVGVINSQEVLEKSVEGKKVLNQLQQRDKDYQKQIANQDEEIRNLETKLNTQRLTLTNEALAQLSSDIERRQTDRKRFAEDKVRELQELTARLFQRIQNELIPIIEQIGKEKNLDIIFDLAKSGAIYFNPAINVTQDLIQKYDASKSSSK